MIEFTVPGEPVAKARPRVTKSGLTFTPAKTVNYETLVKEMFAIECKNQYLEGEIKAEMDFYFTIPKSTSRKKRALMISGEIRPVKRPDTDNVIKSVTDAINGLAYNDDSQIVEIVARKWYGEQPKAVVKLTEIER
jgi:Holliday junction resolvase RusA-like endonuclease